MSVHFKLTVFDSSYLRDKNYFLAPALSYLRNQTRANFMEVA